jgi:hypothetical protein
MHPLRRELASDRANDAEPDHSFRAEVRPQRLAWLKTLVAMPLASANPRTIHFPRWIWTKSCTFYSE